MISLNLRFGLARMALDSFAEARQKSNEIITCSRSTASGAADPVPWNALADILEATYLDLPLKELNERANHAARDDRFGIYACGYIGLSVHLRSTLENAAVAQAMAMPIATHCDMQERI